MSRSDAIECIRLCLLRIAPANLCGLQKAHALLICLCETQEGNPQSWFPEEEKT
jgi:hypothetical protein